MKNKKYTIFIESSLFSLFLFYLYSIYPLIYQISNNELYISFNQLLIYILIFLLFSYIFIKNYLKKFKWDLLNMILFSLVFYIFFSLTFTFLNYRINTNDYFKEIFYSIFPLILLIINHNFISRSKYYFVSVIIFSYLFVIGFSFGRFFNFDFGLGSRYYDAVINNSGSFVSYYGAISMGYFSQLVFSLVLFNKIKIPFRSLILMITMLLTFLTLQRSAYLGIASSSLIYLFTLKKSLFFKVSVIFFIFYLFLLFFSIDLSPFTNIDYRTYILDEFNNFSISNVLIDREGQSIITNTSNFLNIIFGQGFGLYSNNNSLASLRMPDANFQRIYNEMGIIGFVLFFSPFILLLKKAFKFNDYFQIYLIIFSLVAFYFNRVLLMIPINVMFYTILNTRYEKKGAIS